LVSGALNDEGERMVGDIDIVVKADQSQLCHELLRSQGYYQLTQHSIGTKHFGNAGRHLPRLCHDAHPAGVEIHLRLLQKDQHSLLEPQLVWGQSQRSKGFQIPSYTHLFRHAILNWEINDLGSVNKNLSLRSVYDVLVILELFEESIDLEEQNKIKAINKFMQKCAVLYPNHKVFRELKANGLAGRQYAFLLNWPLIDYFNKSNHGLFGFSKLLFNRMRQLIVNKAYRKDVLNKPSYALQACQRAFLRMVFGR